MKRFASVVLVVACFPCFGQAPAFDVASVKLYDGTRVIGPRFRTSADSLTIRDTSLRDCIQGAYQLPQDRVIAPSWLNEIRLDIEAKAAGPVEEKQLFVMLQTLLAARMGLKAHIELRETPVYALTLAKGGPKFSESTSEGLMIVGKDKRGPSMQRISMGEFVKVLSQGFGRPFVDATGLQGRYDIRVDLTPYMPADGSQPDQMATVGILIAAFQEQLGIKVEARTDKIDMLVVDHAERTPNEN